MGILDGLLENVLGIGAQQSQASMLQVALQVLEQNGGLPGIISKFEHGGMSDHVGSWVGTGANMPITGAQLQDAAKKYFNLSNYAKFILLPEK